MNTISPGPIDTPILDGLGKTKADVDQVKALACRSGSASAGWATRKRSRPRRLFFASSDSSFITGVELFVDGGMGAV